MQADCGGSRFAREPEERYRAAWKSWWEIL
jgi:hypothetical protein